MAAIFFCSSTPFSARQPMRWPAFFIRQNLFHWPPLYLATSHMFFASALQVFVNCRPSALEEGRRLRSCRTCRLQQPQSDRPNTVDCPEAVNCLNQPRPTQSPQPPRQQGHRKGCSCSCPCKHQRGKKCASHWIRASVNDSRCIARFCKIW